MNWKIAIACAAVAIVPAAAQADSISSVEGARAKERAGYRLNRQDIEKLRRYGGNDDGYAPEYRYYGYDRPYGYGYGPPPRAYGPYPY